MRTAIITGITGQDGSYLAELLLDKDYQVIGVVRPDSPKQYDRLKAIKDRVEIVEVSLTDLSSLRTLVERHRPSEIYNFAARASSSQLFSDPLSTCEFNGLAVVRLLDIIRQVDPTIRFCQASSSELFGNATESPQSETTVLRPRIPYGIAKLLAHGMVGSYRETHNIFACSSILFKHESPRRGHEFVTRKISMGAARISAGLESKIHLGNLEATRDWGYAGDYVKAMWKMLQISTPTDYVLATGESHSVRDFCDIAFRRVGLDYRNHVVEDPSVKRSGDAARLVGDASKARQLLDWTPTISFEELVCMMVDADLQAIKTLI